MQPTFEMQSTDGADRLELEREEILQVYTNFIAGVAEVPADIENSSDSSMEMDKKDSSKTSFIKREREEPVWNEKNKKTKDFSTIYAEAGDRKLSFEERKWSQEIVFKREEMEIRKDKKQKNSN